MRQIYWVKKFSNRICLVIAIGVLLNSGAVVASSDPEDSITVESKSVCANDESVEIRVRMTNTTEVRHLTVPLEFRTISGGAFVRSVKMSWDERLPPGKTEPLGEFAMTHHYDHKNCGCSNGQTQGYGKVRVSDTLPHSVEVSPYAVMFTRLRLMGGNLLPGRDSIGSMVITLDIDKHAGVFEIDTTCMCPANHLLFVIQDNGPRGINPAFTKGVITVSDCVPDSL